MARAAVWIGIAWAASLWRFLDFQIILELEKQRIDLLCNILTRYNLQMSSFEQTLKHVRHPDLHLDHIDEYYNKDICILLLSPGPKADRTGSPKGGYGQRLTGPGGGKQRHD